RGRALHIGAIGTGGKDTGPRSVRRRASLSASDGCRRFRDTCDLRAAITKRAL
ncbi:hypothetical protein IWW51_006162, partial [Coemansia sp. RSA 2702]